MTRGRRTHQKKRCYGMTWVAAITSCALERQWIRHSCTSQPWQLLLSMLRSLVNNEGACPARLPKEPPLAEDEGGAEDGDEVLVLLAPHPLLLIALLALLLAALLLMLVLLLAQLLAVALLLALPLALLLALLLTAT